MKTRYTVDFLGIWEQIHNDDFNRVEFDAFKNEAGTNSFVLTPLKWITTTNAIGIISKSGRYGGTFAHKDIAFEFASWISAEFKLYLIKEFQRLKEEENSVKNLNWNAKRMLTRMNYKIHTDAIAKHIVPKIINENQKIFVYADIRQLVCLANLESLNTEFIRQELSQGERLQKLNEIAIIQMNSLLGSPSLKKLEN